MCSFANLDPNLDLYSDPNFGQMFLFMNKFFFFKIYGNLKLFLQLPSFSFFFFLFSFEMPYKYVNKKSHF
jgi:hypothetical protein